MAAALKVSAAPKTTDLFLSLKSLPSFPIVVVLPTPLTPEITMIVDLLFPKSDNYKPLLELVYLGEPPSRSKRMSTKRIFPRIQIY